MSLVSLAVRTLSTSRQSPTTLTQPLGCREFVLKFGLLMNMMTRQGRTDFINDINRHFINIFLILNTVHRS